MTARSRSSPDHRAALDQYRQRAGVYDLELALFEPVRRRAIARLGLRPGETVIDVGCGTGLSLPLLRHKVAAGGHVVGIEQSPEMIEKARQRVAQHRWNNVVLVNAPADSAPLPGRADAAIFHFTHDILREPKAIAHVMRHLKPGARIVASGLQWSRFWAWPVNLFVLGAALRSVTTLDGLGRPWSHLATHLDHLNVDTTLAGGVYITSGTLSAKEESP